MATAAILLLVKDDPSSTARTIVDTTTNIDSLWTTALSLVGGYMDFTSYEAGLYARVAQGYTSPELTVGGFFTGRGVPNGAQTFDADLPIIGNVADPVNIDGNPADLPNLQILVNSLRSAVINLANAQPTAS